MGNIWAVAYKSYIIFYIQGRKKHEQKISKRNSLWSNGFKETLSSLDGIDRYYSVNSLNISYTKDGNAESPNNPFVNSAYYKSAYKSLADYSINVYFKLAAR